MGTIGVMRHADEAARRDRPRPLDAVPGLVHGFERRLGPAGRGDARARPGGASRPRCRGQGATLPAQAGARRRSSDGALGGHPEADAAVAARPGLLLGIETADCLPGAPRGPRAAGRGRRPRGLARHRGRRGRGARVEALVAAARGRTDLSPRSAPASAPAATRSATSCGRRSGRRARPSSGPGPRGRPHLDVRAANAPQLERAGRPAERIHHVADCTSCRADLYHSYPPRRGGRGPDDQLRGLRPRRLGRASRPSRRGPGWRARRRRGSARGARG